MTVLPYSLFEPKFMTQPQQQQRQPQQLNLFNFENTEPPKKQEVKNKYNPPIIDRTDYLDGLIGG
jgi:hypothetical protein